MACGLQATRPQCSESNLKFILLAIAAFLAAQMNQVKSLTQATPLGV